MQVTYYMCLLFITLRIIKLSLYLRNSTPHYDDIWGSGGIDPPFLTLALDGGEWSASRHGRYGKENNLSPFL
jgi:hypothetical protein